MSGPVYARRARLWTEAEDRALLDLWEDGRLVEHVAKVLGRSPWGIYLRVRKLTGGTIPRGMEGFTAACRRTGYDHRRLHAILTAHGVRLRAVMAEQIRRNKHGPRHRHWFVDPLDVDDAVAAWLEREPASRAAKRLGIRVRTATLYERLAAIGVERRGKGVPLRVTDEQIAVAINLRRSASEDLTEIRAVTTTIEMNNPTDRQAA